MVRVHFSNGLLGDWAVSMITKEKAIELYESKFWEGMTAREIAEFQLFERLLCVPFAVFQQALQESLGRPVWTHELGMNIEGIRAEFLGEKKPPTMEQIIELIPEEKRIIVIGAA